MKAAVPIASVAQMAVRSGLGLGRTLTGGLPPSGRREPCYGWDEIAERLHVDPQKLHGALAGHRELRPEPRLFSNSRKQSGVSGNLYWLSDFRRWAAHHKLDLTRYA